MAVVKQITLKADTSGAVKNVKKLNKEVTETGTKAKATGQGLKGAFAGFSDALAGAIPMLGRLKTAMISTGVGALVVAFGSLVTLIRSAAIAGADFQQALSGLEAISGASADELDVLGKQAKSLGASTAYTAIQVLELQTELAKLGFTAKGIQDSTPAILDLASALDVDLSNAAALAGSTVRAFGLETEDTQRVVDVLSLSASSVALDFESLKESFKNVAPAARSVGVSVEQTAALLGVLANAGVKGSRGGTKLSTAFIELNAKGLTLDQALEKISTSSNKLGTAMALAGKTGGTALVTLANETPQIAELTKQFENAEGAARKMAEIKLDNLAGDVKELGSAWEGFLLGIEDGDGLINKIQRGAVRLLIIGIETLRGAMSRTSFVVTDLFESLKIGISMTKDIVGGGFGYFTGVIKKFSLEAILAISKIPIIGKAIDSKMIESNLLEAEAQIEASQKRIEQGALKSTQLTIRNATRESRYLKTLKDKEDKLEEANRKEKAEEQELKDIEALEAAEKARLKALEKAEAERLKLLAKFKKKEEDLLADDDLKKLDLDKERNIKAIEALGLGLDQENALKLAYEATYLLKRKEIQDKIREEAVSAEEGYNKEIFDLGQKKLKETEDLARAEELIRQQNLRSAQNALGALSNSLKKGTAGQKTAAIAEIALNTGVGFMNGLKIAQQGAAGTGPLAPFSYPIFAATQIAAVIGMASKAKSIISGVGGGGGGTTPSPPSMGSTPTITESAQPQTPAFNVVGTSGASQIADLMGSQPPVKAFVVSSDVTTAQGLDRNIIESATL